MQNRDLYKKYNKAVPRYTSYPTVPHWEINSMKENDWKEVVKKAFSTYGEDGTSLYIHLPYCESLCTYCGCNTRITINHAVEVPYIEALLKELDLYLNALDEKPIVNDIHLGGGTPTFFSPENLNKLLQGIKAKVKFTSEPEFSFEGHPANTTREHLEVLFNNGFKRLSLGIQDFDPKIQKLINRKQSFEQVKQVVEDARALNYESINFDIIYGLPQQTPESIEDTVGKVIELKPDRIAYYSYAHVPWKHKGQRAYDENDLPTDEEKRALYELGKSMLLNAGLIDIGMDHFSTPEDSLTIAHDKGELHRNFMGYTHLNGKLLIGLGVSSISDVYFGYAQNEKIVERYLEKVNNGILPLTKGHFLSKDEITTRKAVNDILCNGKTEASTISSLPFKTKTQIYKNLHELEADNLVELGGVISVKNEGLKFIRNVAASFDSKLFETQKEKMFCSSI